MTGSNIIICRPEIHCTVEPVYNGHPWDHADMLLYRGGLLIEVGGALDNNNVLEVHDLWL